MAVTLKCADAIGSCRHNYRCGLLDDGGKRGQMTVEMVIALPVMLVVAIIAVNALLFFSECAAFDRLAKDAVRIHATAPGYGEETSRCLANIQADLEESFDKEYLHVSVSAQGRELGHVRFIAALDFTPTLFGRSFSGSVFGVSMPALHHETSLTISPYRPGVIV